MVGLTVRVHSKGPKGSPPCVGRDRFESVALDGPQNALLHENPVQRTGNLAQLGAS